MESRHSVEGQLVVSFRRSIGLSLGSYRGLKSQVVEDFRPKCAFLQKRPLAEGFSKMCSERIHRVTDPRIVCKFREIWPTGNRWSRALFRSQKTIFRFALSLSFLRAQNLPGTAADVLKVPQISSKSVNLRWSYSGTRENRSNAP